MEISTRFGGQSLFDILLLPHSGTAPQQLLLSMTDYFGHCDRNMRKHECNSPCKQLRTGFMALLNNWSSIEYSGKSHQFPQNFVSSADISIEKHKERRKSLWWKEPWSNGPYQLLVIRSTGFHNNWSSAHKSRKSIWKGEIEGSSADISINSRTRKLRETILTHFNQCCSLSVQISSPFLPNSIFPVSHSCICYWLIGLHGSVQFPLSRCSYEQMTNC